MMELSDMVVFASSDHGPYNSHQTPTRWYGQHGGRSCLHSVSSRSTTSIPQPGGYGASSPSSWPCGNAGSPDGPSSSPGSCLNCCPAAPYQDTWPDCFRNRNGPWCRSLRQARRYSQHRSREYSQSGGPEGSIPKVP